MFGEIARYRDRVITDAIMPKTTWRGRVQPVS